MEKARADVAADIERIKQHVRETAERAGHLRDALLGRFKAALASVYVTDMAGNRYPAFDVSKTDVIPVQMTYDCLRDFEYKWQWTQAGTAFYKPVNGTHPLLDTVIRSIIHQSCV
jgi:hypothetical protein